MAHGYLGDGYGTHGEIVAGGAVTGATGIASANEIAE